MNLPPRKSITWKVLSGFGVVLGLLALISIVSLMSLRAADQYFKDYRALARQTVADGRVQANMLMTRIYAKNFVINASPDNIQGVEDRAKATLLMIEEARLLSSDAGFRLVLDSLQRELNDYLDHFGKVTRLQVQRDDLVHGTLNVIGPQMERDLTAIMESAFADGDTEAAYRAGMTMRNLLLARLYAGRFLIQNDHESFQRVGREFLDMQQNLDKLVGNLENPKRLELAAKVRDEQRAYSRTFENVHDLITLRNGIIENQLDAIGPKVADNIERLKLAIKEQQDTLGPKAEASINQAVGVVAAVVLASMLFGGLAAWLIGTGVSRQVRTMAGTMKELAGGNLDATVTGTGGSSEIEEMAAAVGIFRESMIRVNQLVEEQRMTALKIQAAKETAVSANKAKSEFLANMSHELRTPMNAILGYSEMLIEESQETGQTSYIPDLKKINQAGSHLLSLINDVLDLSKIESGKMEAFPENIDLDSLIDEVRTTAHPLMERNHNTLLVQKERNLGTASQDITKLRQILLNLLSNAAKFTHNGTVTLTLNRLSRDKRDWLTLAVSDTGIGIAPDKLPQIFDEFVQADDSTTRDYGGTGLGLPISKRFCELLGGELTVHSTKSVGTTFTVTLPAHLPSSSTLDDSDAPEPASRNGKQHTMPAIAPGSTILVIDDDPEACEIIERSLSKKGFKVVKSASGEDGLRLAESLQPSAITLDVVMPGLDGWTVLRDLKTNPLLSHIPVIMLTMVDDRSRGYALGAVDYLTKPVDRDQLHKILSYYHKTDGPSSVLLIEDDPRTRDLMARTLETGGWVVREASNGRDALNLLAVSTSDLILLDLIMPVMDGFAFLAELRSKEEWQRIPVVVVTAKDLNAHDRQLLSGETETILEKSKLTREQLLRQVSEAIADSGLAHADQEGEGQGHA